MENENIEHLYKCTLTIEMFAKDKSSAIDLFIETLFNKDFDAENIRVKKMNSTYDTKTGIVTSNRVLDLPRKEEL